MVNPDPRLEGLSKDQICALRLRCIEPYIAFAAKYGVEKEEVFKHAEKSWEFMLKALGEDKQEVTQSPP